MGVDGAVRAFWEYLLVTLKALIALLPDAPVDVLRRFLRWLADTGFGRFLVDAMGR